MGNSRRWLAILWATMTAALAANLGALLWRSHGAEPRSPALLCGPELREVASTPPSLGRSGQWHLALWVGAAAVVVAVSLGGFAWRSQQQRTEIAVALTGGDPSRAPQLMRRYGCAGCHTIPGIAGADGQVGGSLAGLRQRVYVAGVVPNAADNLVHWIVAPTSLNPRTAMPVTGITEREARDVAAYLYAR